LPFRIGPILLVRAIRLANEVFPLALALISDLGGHVGGFLVDLGLEGVTCCLVPSLRDVVLVLEVGLTAGRAHHVGIFAIVERLVLVQGEVKALAV
jgi:hypothetical protein